MVQGWFFAGIVGVCAGALVGISSTARSYLQFTLEFVRPLPASAVIPVAISIFGLSSQMAIAVIVFGSIWPTLLSTVYGFAAIDPRLVEVSQCLRMSRMEFIHKIGLPSALPDILSGLRLSLTIALILAVITEMLAAQTGLGTTILLAARSFRSADLFAGIVLLGLIGLLSDNILKAAENYFLVWMRK
jgi:ABC-type nitrate/sulfonate/bicarbonate transport system permease component